MGRERRGFAENVGALGESFNNACVQQPSETHLKLVRCSDDDALRLIHLKGSNGHACTPADSFMKEGYLLACG